MLGKGSVKLIIIGASAASPTLVVKTENCLYVWYVRIPYIHSALFVCDAIFPHCTHVATQTSSTERLNSGQQGLENSEEREAGLARRILIISGVLRYSAVNKECSVYRAISL